MTFQDNYGNNFNTRDGQAPAFPQQVVVQTPNGPAPGYWSGSQVVPDKK